MTESSSDTGFLERFRAVEPEVKEAISALSSKLKLGLCVLTLSQDRFGREYLSLDEMVDALDRLGVAMQRDRLAKALSRAGNRVRRVEDEGIKKYKAMTVGKKEVEEAISIAGPEIMYVDRSKPRTARRRFRDIASKLIGAVRVCDPYYGVETLDVLEEFPAKCKVRFMTTKTTEKPSKINRAIADFVREHGNVAIRIYPYAGELHDRYIITKARFLLVGHGIKDLGKKESFIIQVDSSIAPDLMKSLIEVFDERWNVSNPV